jgi:hypothetical protein
MIAIIPEPVIGIPGTVIGIVRNPQHHSVHAAPNQFSAFGFGRCAVYFLT